MSHTNDKADTGDFSIENARIIGGKYEVFLAFTQEYRLTVDAGVTRKSAIEEATELALHGDVPIYDRELLHSEVDQIDEIFEDDVEAGKVSWLDEPTAPSEETYWDDTEHFPEHAPDPNADQGEDA